jgi:ABC-type uncharacterized transport system ATPase component
MAKIVCTNLTKEFEEADGTIIKAVSNVSSAFLSGSLVMIIGANGSGKSTFLRLIGGQLSPTAGEVAFVDESTKVHLTPHERTRLSTWIVQSPSAGSMGEFSVAENLRLALLPAKASPIRPALDSSFRALAEKMLSESPLGAKLSTQACNLSQGQKQLLSIEMAMARKPLVLLADEPTASLDRRHTKLCLARLRELANSGTCVIVVTHDIAAAREYADSIVVVREGSVTSYLSREETQRQSVSDLLELGGFLDIDPSPIQRLKPP